MRYSTATNGKLWRSNSVGRFQSKEDGEDQDLNLDDSNSEVEDATGTEEVSPPNRSEQVNRGNDLDALDFLGGDFFRPAVLHEGGINQNVASRSSSDRTTAEMRRPPHRRLELPNNSRIRSLSDAAPERRRSDDDLSQYLPAGEWKTAVLCGPRIKRTNQMELGKDSECADYLLTTTTQQQVAPDLVVPVVAPRTSPVDPQEEEEEEELPHEE